MRRSSMNDADSGNGGNHRQEQNHSGTGTEVAGSGGRRRSSMNDAVAKSSATAAASTAAAAAGTSGRPGRRSSYTNRRSSFGTTVIPPPPGSSSSANVNAGANRRASQDSAVSSSSYNRRRGSQTSQSHNQGRIDMLRDEIAQLKEAAERELREREGDIHALRVEKAGYEEKQREMESEMHDHVERQRQQEMEEKKKKEEAERKANQKQPQPQGRRRSGLLQRRPSLNSLSSWGAMAKLDHQSVDSSSDEEKGGSRTALSRRSSSASLAALAVLNESLNGGFDYKDDKGDASSRKNVADGAGDEPPRSIEVSPRRASSSLHDSLANLGGDIQREQMRRRPSLSSLVGWARVEQEAEDHAVDAARAEDNQSLGRMSRRNSFGSLSAMSMGLSSADLDGDSSCQDDEIGSADQTLTSDDKTSSVGRLGGMHKASSMRSVASNLDIESMRSKLQRRSSDRGVISSNVASTRWRSAEDIPLSTLAAFDGMKKSGTGRRHSLEDIPLSSLGVSGGMNRVSSASALSALADMLGSDSDGDNCDRSIGAHSAGPLMSFTGRLNDGENDGRRKQGNGKMKRRGSFGGLGGALANLGIGGGDDDRSIGGHSLGAMAFASGKNEKAQRRPSLGSLQLFGHAKANWSKEQADQLLKEGGETMKRSSSFSALSNMADDDNGSDIGDRSVGAHSLGPFMLGDESRRGGEESGKGRVKRRPSLGALGLFGQANWSKEQADKMVEESTKEKMMREREERIKRTREERQRRYDEQVNKIKSSMGAAEKRKDELRQANKEQGEQIGLLRLQVRAAKAKREGKLSAKRRESIGAAASDVTEVDSEKQQRQLKEIQGRIDEGRARWSTISEKLDEADANVDSLERIVRRMKRKAIEAMEQGASDNTSSPVNTPVTDGSSIDISWNTVPDLLAMAVPVWDRVVRESDTERTRAKARHRIIATCSYRLAKDLNKGVVGDTPPEGDGTKSLDETNRCAVDKGIAEAINSTSQAVESSASSLEQDTKRTKLALSSTQAARSIAEKMILRDISLFHITKSILNLCKSVALSSADNGDVRSRLLADYTSFRCDRSGLAISSKLRERLEVLRCRGDERDLTVRSLERKKEQMEAKVNALKQSIGETTIDIIERKQYFMLGMARLADTSKPMQKTLRMQQLQIQNLTHEVSECDKKTQIMEIELRKLRGT